MGNTNEDYWHWNKDEIRGWNDRDIVPTFELRDGHNYLSPFGCQTRDVAQAQVAFFFDLGSKTKPDEFAEILDEVKAVIEAAIENVDQQDFEAWKASSGDAIVNYYHPFDGVQAPSHALASAMGIAPSSNFTEKQLYSALGLWLCGEAEYYAREQKTNEFIWALGQIIGAAFEARYAAALEFAAQSQKDFRKRTSGKAVLARHGANQKRKAAAKQWFASDGKLLRRADAARRMVELFSITEGTAKNWFDDFKKPSS